MQAKKKCPNCGDGDLLRPTAGRVGAMERVYRWDGVLRVIEAILVLVVGFFLLLFLSGERIFIW